MNADLGWGCSQISGGGIKGGDPMGTPWEHRDPSLGTPPPPKRGQGTPLNGGLGPRHGGGTPFDRPPPRFRPPLEGVLPFLIPYIFFFNLFPPPRFPLSN